VNSGKSNDKKLLNGTPHKKELILHCVSKAKQTRKERTFFMKQMQEFMKLKQNFGFGVTMLENFYMSHNQTFLMFEKPVN
jgi:hypothetical protein